MFHGKVKYSTTSIVTEITFGSDTDSDSDSSHLL